MPKSRTNKRKKTSNNNGCFGNKSKKGKTNSGGSISRGTFISNYHAVKKLINSFRTYDSNYLSRLSVTSTFSDPDMIIDVIEQIKSSKVSLTGENTGSALFPVYSNTWVLGCFGSIFLDVKVENEEYRVAFYNDLTPSIFVYNNGSVVA